MLYFKAFLVILLRINWPNHCSLNILRRWSLVLSP